MEKNVDFLAPGAWIRSLGLDPSVDVTKEGTSMACPHAAGVAAIFTSVSFLIIGAIDPNNADICLISKWLGLANGKAPQYVYKNSLSGLVSGFPSGTKNLLINTGIHAPKKYWREPFRWAGNNPVKKDTNKERCLRPSTPTCGSSRLRRSLQHQACSIKLGYTQLWLPSLVSDSTCLFPSYETPN